MIHDHISNWKLYFSAPPWHRVFEFLESLTPDAGHDKHIPLGDDGMYAAIMSYDTVPPAESVLETHDRHVDIQLSLVNSEAIDWFPRNTLEIETPYDNGKDRTLYHRPAVCPGRVCNFPGYFTVLFPDDAHMPKMITGSASELVKKVVVKLPCSSI